MAAEYGFESMVGKLVDAGGKAADVGQKLAEISLEATRKALHSQVALGVACAEVATGQLRSLGSLTSPADFLQSQKDVGETLSGKLTAYTESLREIGTETQAAYSAVTKELFAGFWPNAA